MRFGLVFICLFGWLITAFSQKPLIDSSVFHKWPSVNGIHLSKDGNYAYYNISNQPSGSNTLCVKSLRGVWEREFVNVFSEIKLSDDSRRLFIKDNRSVLTIVELGTSVIDSVKHVRSFKTSGSAGGEYLAYVVDSPLNNLVLLNLVTDKREIISHVTGYWFNESGTVLVVQKSLQNSIDTAEEIAWINLEKGKTNIIWAGTKVRNIILDQSQLAFLTERQSNDTKEVSCYYYKSGLGKAYALISEKDIVKQTGLLLHDVVGFTKNDRGLLIRVRSKDLLPKQPDFVAVDVWSYRDSKLQSQQLNELEDYEIYTCCIDVESGQLVQLESAQDHISGEGGSYILVRHDGGDTDPGERNWNRHFLRTWFLISLEDKKKVAIKTESSLFLSLSSAGKYTIFYDPDKENYFTYESSTGLTINVTQGIVTDWREYENDHPDARNAVYGVEGWGAGDSVVYLRDQFDLWSIDPTGKRRPISMTNGYGAKHNIQFRLVVDYTDQIVKYKGRFLLAALDRNNLNNGFFSTDPGRNPKQLTMGPYLYYFPPVGGVPPVSKKDVYVVRRMSATESPNYFWTKDFVHFKFISHVHPESDYNWISDELVSFKTSKGLYSKGVLFKPDNFDSTKKYPVIFNYYEIKSTLLNQFPEPAEANDIINIPYFVSNGYLVFLPDIHYTEGNAGQDALDAVISAANYMKRYHWVDSLRMGIEGHSFGGFETNFIITHSPIFAAAESGAGVADAISDYGDLWGNGPSKEGYWELSQGRAGSSLWERPDFYLKNSPVLLADKVSTPLLMLNNIKDPAVSFKQGIEFFTALRRLGKKVWMLQYDGFGHGVGGPAAEDFTIRLMQFFDYYLKGKPAPIWMTRGIPAIMKQRETGLELDSVNVVP